MDKITCTLRRYVTYTPTWQEGTTWEHRWLARGNGLTLFVPHLYKWKIPDIQLSHVLIPYKKHPNRNHILHSSGAQDSVQDRVKYILAESVNYWKCECKQLRMWEKRKKAKSTQKRKEEEGTMWHLPVIPALKMWRQKHHEIKASFGYIVNWRLAKAMWDSVRKKNLNWKLDSLSITIISHFLKRIIRSTLEYLWNYLPILVFKVWFLPL